jgi:hypothetical protein
VFTPVGTQPRGHDWEAVKILLRGTDLIIEQHNGQQLRGRLESVDDTKIAITTRRPFSLAIGPRGEHLVTVQRSAIQAIAWVILHRRPLLGFIQRNDDLAVVYGNP